MIQFNCPACGKTLAIQDEYAGRQARCPSCGNIITIPATPFQGSAPPPPEQPAWGGPVGPQPPPLFPPPPPPPWGFQPGWTPPQPQPPPVFRPPESLDIKVGPVISEAWHILTANLWPFIGVFLLYWVVISVASQCVPFGGLILTGPLECGLALYCLKKTRGEYAEVSDLFGGFKFFGRALGAYWLMALLTFLAFLALFVPGIIVALGFSLTYFFIIDTQLGVWDSMMASWNILKGYKWQLFLISLVCGLINILGILCLFVGLLVTVPLSFIAIACVYHRLRTKQAMALQAQAASRPQSGPQWSAPPPPPGGETLAS
jgi:DNA-directed RNA polymerase subunit RPC12/RpoP